MSLFGVWFEDLGGSGWGFGRWVQVNDLAWMACSKTSSIPPPIMPQLFPVKHSFVRESTLNSMKEHVKGRGEGRGEEKEGKCHRCLLFGCVCGFSLQLDSLPPWRAPCPVATEYLSWVKAGQGRPQPTLSGAQEPAIPFLRRNSITYEAL